MMPLMRVSDRAKAIVEAIARQRGKSQQAVLDEAVEAYRRSLRIEELNRAYAQLRENPKAWADELEERSRWAGAEQDPDA